MAGEHLKPGAQSSTRCTAKSAESCPFTKDGALHFENKEAAEQYIAQEAAKNGTIVKSIKKQPVKKAVPSGKDLVSKFVNKNNKNYTGIRKAQDTAFTLKRELIAEHRALSNYKRFMDNAYSDKEKAAWQKDYDKQQVHIETLERKLSSQYYRLEKYFAKNKKDSVTPELDNAYVNLSHYNKKRALGLTPKEREEFNKEKRNITRLEDEDYKRRKMNNEFAVESKPLTSISKAEDWQIPDIEKRLNTNTTEYENRRKNIDNNTYSSDYLKNTDEIYDLIELKRKVDYDNERLGNHVDYSSPEGMMQKTYNDNKNLLIEEAEIYKKYKEDYFNNRRNSEKQRKYWKQEIIVKNLSEKVKVNESKLAKHIRDNMKHNQKDTVAV